MGSDQYHVLLYTRGSMGWDNVARVTEQDTSYGSPRPAIAVDGQDRAHVIYQMSPDATTYWNRYSGSLLGEEQVHTHSSFNTFYSPIMFNGSDEPLLTLEAVDGGSIDAYVRSGGTWSSSSVSNDGRPGTLTRMGTGDLHAFWRDESQTTDILVNSAPDATSFSVGSSTEVSHANEVERTMSSRWQQRYDNEPSTPVIDMLFTDASNGALYYHQVTDVTVVTGIASLAGSSTFTGAGTIVYPGVLSAAGSASLAASGTPVTLGVASPSGSSTVTASGTVATSAVTAIASLSASSTLSASGTEASTAVASPTGGSTVSASGTPVVLGIATPSGSATVVASGTGVVTSILSAAAGASASAFGRDVNLGVVAASGSASVGAAGTPVRTGVASPTGASRSRGGPCSCRTCPRQSDPRRRTAARYRRA
jgi:hypothetical protein